MEIISMLWDNGLARGDTYLQIWQKQQTDAPNLTFALTGHWEDIVRAREQFMKEYALLATFHLDESEERKQEALDWLASFDFQW